jgi:serine/threonine protein phosphatase PrpC
VKLDVGWKSDRGLNPDRPENEDSCAASRRQSDRGMVTIAIVADGLGGMARGQAASEAALASFLRGESLPPVPSRAALADWLSSEMVQANDSVRGALQGASGGTTCTAVALLSGILVLSHIGDTRAYLASGGEVRILTTDHSLDEALRAAGQPLAEDGSGRSALLRSLGSHDALPAGYIDDLATRGVVGETRWTKFLPGETLLLCSDGLWDVVANEVVSDLLTSNYGAQAIVNALVQHALDAGAPDNVSALVVRRIVKDDQSVERRVWGPGPAVHAPPARPLGESRTVLPSVQSALKVPQAEQSAPPTHFSTAEQDPADNRVAAAKPAGRKPPWRIALPALVGAALAAGIYGLLSPGSPSASAPTTQVLPINESVRDMFLTRKYWGRDVSVVKAELGASIAEPNSADAVVVGEVSRTPAGTLTIQSISVAEAKRLLVAGGLTDQPVREIEAMISGALPAVKVRTELTADDKVSIVEVRLVDDSIELFLTGKP